MFFTQLASGYTANARSTISPGPLESIEAGTLAAVLPLPRQQGLSGFPRKPDSRFRHEIEPRLRDNGGSLQFAFSAEEHRCAKDPLG